MTSPTPDNREAIARIEQCDRDAAADFYRQYLARPNEVPVEQAMRVGHIDESPLIQAFAKHRTDAILATRPHDVWREGVEAAFEAILTCPDGEDRYGVCAPPSRKDYLAAIRNLVATTKPEAGE